jgi:hypothetical protein
MPAVGALGYPGARQRFATLRYVRVAATALALAICAFFVASASATQDASRQACVDSWNWTTYTHADIFGHRRPVTAEVLTRPCRVWIHYDAGFWVPCGLDRYHVFACGEHGLNPSEITPLRIRPNAVYNPLTGVLRLTTATATTTPKPAWVRRWRWDQGFIYPFDKQGRVLPGITLKRADFHVVCGPNYRGSLVGSCGAGGYAIFPHWPMRKGDLFVYTYWNSRGSTVYTSVRAQ